MRRAFATLALVLLTAQATTAADSPAPGLRREVAELAASMERYHPDLFHAVSRKRFRAEAAALAQRAPSLSRAQLVVGLMRLTALPGVRDGHTGIYAADPSHSRPLRLYPLRLYDFPDGLRVIGATSRQDLVGKRLTAVNGTPVARVVAAVRPLVPHDNEWSRRHLLPEWIVTQEVLQGLGIVAGRTATFSFEGGVDAALAPVAAAEFRSVLGAMIDAPVPPGPRPVWLQRLEVPHWLTTLDHGRVVYLGYRLTLGETDQLARRLLRLARRPGVRRVIVDIRLNHGGNNRTYGPLLEALVRPEIDRPGRLTLLLGRGTFSAAGNFAADVDRYTRATLVGEPSGGAPRQWGDPTPIDLPLAGLRAYVATSYQQYAEESDKRLAVKPDVAVQTGIADFLAGRDPVLAAALR
ncbi:MAG TPA: hypothetical protein VJ689_08690 [Gaiellaceae bacterium]|nr:hypothetical protein [Gaiellaceae bacterium]